MNRLLLAAALAVALPCAPALAQNTIAQKVAVCDPANASAACVVPVSANIVTGQQKVAVTGTAVQFQTASAPLVNGLKFCALTTNSAAVTVGGSGVTNVVDGTGNGAILLPGQCGAIAISNVNLLYLNGTAGAGISWGPDN